MATVDETTIQGIREMNIFEFGGVDVNSDLGHWHVVVIAKNYLRAKAYVMGMLKQRNRPDLVLQLEQQTRRVVRVLHENKPHIVFNTVQRRAPDGQSEVGLGSGILQIPSGE